jgi:acyl-CoA thioester hydrolase
MDFLSEFPVITELPVQWGDQDALGHVNNVVFFRWWETARIDYCRKIGLMRDDASLTIGTVLAAMQCDFRRQLAFPDTVRIGSRLARVGNSSIRIEHQLISLTQNEIAAEAVSTIVAFDFEKQVSLAVPDSMRAAMRKLEAGRTIEGLA